MLRKLTLTAIVIAVIAIAGVVGQTAKAEYYGGVSYSFSMKMERYIHLWFDRTGDAWTMICIARRESGLNPRAYNDDFAPRESVAGLFQIKWPLWARRGETWQSFYRRMRNPIQNIKLARQLYNHSGLAPWGGGC